MLIDDELEPAFEAAAKANPQARRATQKLNLHHLATEAGAA
jgi:hypothetical protein